MKHWIEAAPGGHKARIRFVDGSTRSKTFPTVREARAWLRRSLTEINDGTFIPEASGKMLFAEWVDRWRATTVDLAPNTVNRRDSDIRNWVLPAFEAKRLGAIAQPDVKTWIAEMARAGCNPGSIKLRYETLSTIMRAAVDAEKNTWWPSEKVAYTLPFEEPTAREGKTFANVDSGGSSKTKLAVQCLPPSLLRDTKT